ncbi:Hypothetical_protein [Hexamita inflata]|uniref:Hypothetical_protein n=1 Tax=Hexamita inflata TaxID=28002 RepID=A0AA86UCE9_9EUKA|nr:Hypothetical protein HINF_LOCUS37814 [Hexamita inflata]
MKRSNESIIDHTKQSWYFSSVSSALTSNAEPNRSFVKIYLTHLTFVYTVSVYTKMLKYCKYQNTINQVKVKESYKDNFRGQQCQFKQRTNLGCLRRLFRVTILEDEV